MRFLRTNTAVIITVGPFYDKTDGVTIKTALTITNERITLTADTDAGSAPTNILDNITGATSGTANDLNYITGNDAGMMQLELAAADVNRVGRMMLSITDAANHVPVFHEFFVLPQAIYDWFTGVIVPLPANVTQLLGTAWLTPGAAGTPDVNAKQLGAAPVTATTSVTIPAAATLATTAGAVGSVTGAVGSVTGAVGSVTAGVTLAASAIQAIWDALTSALTTVGSIGKLLVDRIDAAITSRMATYTQPAGFLAATFPSDPADQSLVIAATDAILADTNDIQARLPAALTGAGNIKADALALNGNVTAAAVLAILNGATVVYQGTATGAVTTTTLIDTGLTQADTDWWKGRIILFTSVLTLQATDITAFDPATDKLTFTAVTNPPTGATYVII